MKARKKTKDHLLLNQKAKSPKQVLALIWIHLMKTVLLENGQQMLGPREKKGGWISDSTWKKVVQTNEKKRNIWSAKSMRQKYKLQVEYRAIDKKEVTPPPKKNA